VIGRVLGFFYGISVLVAASLLALLLGTFTVLPFVVVPRGRRERWAIHGARWWADLVVRGLLLARPTVTGQANVPDGQGALYVCNHRSWVDPMLMITHTRSQGLSKASVFWIPFVGLFGYLTGAVFFDRGSQAQRKRAREEVMWLVRQGARIHMFPEGSRTRDGRIAEKVHLTLPKDCWEAGLPVVPCAVWGTERALPPTESLARPLQPCRLDIGEPIWPRDYQDAEAFAEACWADVVARAGRLRAEDGA
jgi:1-acyl-sn-glycerol-3-phosphate acyltransferase